MSRIRKAILTKKSKVIRSLIPVLDFNYVPCMFDEMSSEFFYNQGKGEFITGPEITEK